MKIGIMQPYFMPYIGYFQLIDSVDKFVVADDLQYIKQGWINRNRILINGQPSTFIFSLKKGPQKLNINQRFFNSTFEKEKFKFLKSLEKAYKRAPYYDAVMNIIKDTLNYEGSMNIADFNYKSLKIICNYLEIKTEFLKSSELKRDKNLKCERLIIDIVKRLNGNIYINSIGGQKLYSKEAFKSENIDLYFINTHEIKYKQYKNEFAQNLSIIDVLMFNSKDECKKIIKMYDLI